jgi:PAS domain S-box-containing protein
MSEPIKILILEDVPSDAELMQRELRKAGLQFNAVMTDTRKGFVEQLEKFHPDIILADYQLPSFDGLAALDIVREKSPATPFIIISGSIGEDLAVEALKRGANDYFLKDRISKLGSAVERALREAKEHKKLQQAQVEIVRHSKSLELLYQCSLDLALLPEGTSVGDTLTEWLKKLSGGYAVTFGKYDRTNKEIVLKRILLDPGALAKIEEAVGKRLLDLRSPVSPEAYREMMGGEIGTRSSLYDISFGAVPKLASAAIGGLFGVERYLAVVYQTEGKLYGTSVIALKKGQPEPDHAMLKAFGALGAVSLRRTQAEEKLQTAHEQLQAGYQEIEANNQELMAAEEELRQQNEELTASEAALRKSQKQLNNANQLAHIGSWYWTAETDTVTWTEELYLIAGIDPSLPAPTYAEHSKIYAPESLDRLKTAVEKAMSAGEEYQLELELIRPDGGTRWVNAFGGTTKDKQGKIIGLYGTMQNITERKLAEGKLIENARLLRIAGDKAKLGGWSVDLKNNRCTWSDETAAIHERPSGYSPLVEEGISYYAPEWREIITKVFTECAQNGIPYDEEMEINTANGKRVWVRTIGEPVKDETGKIIKVQGAFQDITERKRSEKIMQSLSSRQEAMLEAIPEIIMEVDTGKRYTWANQVGLQFFGDDVIGHEAANYFEGEQKTYETVKPLFNGFENVIYVESWQRRRDGQKRLLAWWCRTLKNERGEVTGALSSAHDITEQRENEEKIEKQLTELQRWQSTMLDREDRVLELKREVNEQLARQGQPAKYGG